MALLHLFRNIARIWPMTSMLRATAMLLGSVILPACSPVDALNATIAEDGVTVQHDIAYASGPRRELDVYRPAGAIGRLPLVLFVYGGSWSSGSKADYKFVAVPLARQGLVVVVADYRLVPEVHFPGFVQDVAQATAFAHTHAAEWGGDPQQMFLMGHSAGAYNVLMLGLDARYLAAAGMSRNDLSGVISLAGPADFLPLDDSATIAAFGQYPDLPATQPVNFADGHNPPLLLLHGQSDTTVYLRNSTALAARVRASGGSATLITYPGIGHIGLVTAIAPLFDSRAPVTDDVMNFIHAQPTR